jgi:hypothetical protein
MILDDREMNHRLIKLTENPHFRMGRADFQVLSLPERVFMAVWDLETQVNNGGFRQYFLNNSGRLTCEVVGALRTIGAESAAAIVQQPIAAVGENLPWHDDPARQAEIKALSTEIRDKLDSLTQRFFLYPDNLTALLYRYVCRHRKELRAPDDF